MKIESGELGFFARPLIQANLPYRRVDGGTFQRLAGRLSVTFQAPPEVGLPYGRYPRLLLAWVATEAVKKQSRHLELGRSAYAIMKAVGVTPSGGEHGPRRRLLDQMKRLFSTTITVTWDGETSFASSGYRITSSTYVWWTPVATAPAEAQGRLSLSREFFEELLRSPVPIDLAILRSLTSSLALDIYSWLSYRSATLERPLTLSWEMLHGQFGSQTKRVRDFRRAFIRALRTVVIRFPAQVHADSERLRVWPGTVGS